MYTTRRDTEDTCVYTYTYGHIDALVAVNTPVCSIENLPPSQDKSSNRTTNTTTTTITNNISRDNNTSRHVSLLHVGADVFGQLAEQQSEQVCQ
jgi:hypothetical protein